MASAPRSPTPPPEKPSAAWSRLKRWFGGAERARAPAAAQPAAPAWPSFGGAPDRPLPQLSDYELHHVVARNERTEIHRATERATGRVVALKMVRIGAQGGSPDRGLWRERYLRESAAAARLRHANIVRVRAGGVSGEGDALTGWLAMEWVNGTDLSRYASPSRVLPHGMVLGICQRVALALDFAHAAGVVHRDVKPSNVLFDPSTGLVKVTDFGSARVADAAATRSGLIMGTPAYMAPEQLAGAEVTARCDLYALGVMLYELLTGERPFAADSMGELLSQVAHRSPPRLRSLRPDLPPLLDQIVGRLLAKDPNKRQASGQQVALELRLAQAHCEHFAPGGSPVAWADTLPAEEPGRIPANEAPATRAIQGTIGH